IVHRLVVDLDHHISRAESSLFSATAFFHRAHQHSVAVLDSKEIAQLRSNVFHHQPAAHRRVHDHHRHGQVEVHRGYVDLRYVDLDVWFPRHRLAPVGKLHLDGQRLTVAANAEIHHAAWRHFSNHAAQLSRTLYRRTVQTYDHVVFVQSGFSGGSVLVDHRNLGSVLFLELQFSQTLGRNVSDVHSEIRRSAALFGIPVPAFAGVIIGR